MTVEYAILTQLKATPAVTLIAGDRIYPVVAKQTGDGAIQPYVVFSQSGRIEDLSWGATAMTTKRFDVAAVAENYDTAHELADAIVATLGNWNFAANGLLGGALGVDVQNIAIEDQFDLVDDNFDLGFFMVQTVMTVSYRT